MFEKTPFETPFDVTFSAEGDVPVSPGTQAMPGVVEGTDLADIIGPGTVDADGDEVDGADGLDDVIDAGLGDDIIDAGDGDDTIIGGAGADDIDGGAGQDFLDFSGSSSAVDVSLGGGSGSRGDAAGDTYTSIEGIIGTAFNDRFVGLSKKGSVIFAGDGNDFLSARGGSVEFYGEAGNDFFQVDNGRSHTNAIFDGGEGFDQFVFFGTPKTQTFRDDVFTGFERLDMRGATYEFNADQIGDFQEVRNAGTLDIDLNGATKIDLSGINFNSAAAKTILRGSDANEEFVGSEVADTIEAGAGRDILKGGLGADVLSGGAGADRFVFGPVAEGAEITDFNASEGDRIDISDFIRSIDFVTLVLAGGGKDGSDDILDHNQVRGHGGSSHFFVTVTQVGDDTELTITQRAPVAGSAPVELDFTLTLTGVTASDLTLDDFALSEEVAEPVPNVSRSVSVVRPETDGTPGIVEGTELADVIGAGFVDVDGDAVDGADGLDDVIEAGDGDDTINAGDGDDTIDGGAGADAIDGGDGIDTVTYEDAEAGIRLDRSNGTLGDATGDQLSNVEIIVGTDFRDEIISDFDEVHGGGGNDILRLRSGDAYGGDGSDFFTIGDPEDFFGSILDGGTGNDRLRVDAVGENDLRDITIREIESLEFDGAFGLQTGIMNADQVNFASIRASDKSDLLFVVKMADETDLDLSGVSVSTARVGKVVSFDLDGDADNETITGAVGRSNDISGDAGDDVLTGGAQADTIDGGDDNDILIGQAGEDILTGGAGADTFVFTEATDADTITDFTQGEDLIDLSALVRDFDAFTLIAPSAGKGGFALLDSSQTRKKGDSTDITISVTQDGDDAVLAITSDAPVVGTALADLDITITLEDVDGLGLTLDDFVF